MTTDTLDAGQGNTDTGQQQPDGGNPSSTDASKSPADQQLDGGKPADKQPEPGKQGDDGKGKEGEKTDGGDPYVFELKMPEGLEIDQEALAEFEAIAKDKTLKPAELAQKVLDLAAKREQNRIEAHKGRVAQWADEVRGDKDIGGDKLTETLSVAKKAIDLGPPELKELLNVSGLGNHPAVVKWAYAVGKALSEDRFVKGSPAGGQAAAGDEGRAQRLYGSTAAKA